MVGLLVYVVVIIVFSGTFSYFFFPLQQKRDENYR